MIRTNVMVEIDLEEAFNYASEELQEKIINENIDKIDIDILKYYLSKNFSFYEISNWFDYNEVAEFINSHSDEYID